MLTGVHWEALGPLVEACRSEGKAPPHDLRRAIEAILWRHENGAKWRSIPADLGPLGSRGRGSRPGGADDRPCRSWWTAAQTFIRPRRPPRRSLLASALPGWMDGLLTIHGRRPFGRWIIRQKAAASSRQGRGHDSPAGGSSICAAAVVSRPRRGGLGGHPRASEKPPVRPERGICSAGGPPRSACRLCRQPLCGRSRVARTLRAVVAQRAPLGAKPDPVLGGSGRVRPYVRPVDAAAAAGHHGCALACQGPRSGTRSRRKGKHGLT